MSADFCSISRGFLVLSAMKYETYMMLMYECYKWIFLINIISAQFFHDDVEEKHKLEKYINI